MSSMIRDAKAPGRTPIPVATGPTASPEVEEASRAEAERLRKRKGWKSTMETGAQGVTSTPTTEKTLLGQ